MQLIAGRTAQEYNQCKNREGAFWEDRYHATAIEANEHLHRCLVYIDLNMVRGGVVHHPGEWFYSGYREIQRPPERYSLIDLAELAGLCGFVDVKDLQKAHREWVEQVLGNSSPQRGDRCSEALAVGSLAFVETIKGELGVKATHRDFQPIGEGYALRDPSEPYVAGFSGKV